jgi:hypothetical protein
VYNIVRLSHKHEITCTPASMGFVVDRVALGQIFNCQYQSINDPYSFIHLSPALYNLNTVLLVKYVFHMCRLEMFNYMVKGVHLSDFRDFRLLPRCTWDLRRVVIRFRRFRTTYRTHHQGSASSGKSMLTCRNLPVEMGLIGCPETSARNCNTTWNPRQERISSTLLVLSVLWMFV